MTGKLFKTCAIVMTVLWLIEPTTVVIHAAVSYRTIVLTGDAAPGTEPGAVFRHLEGPKLNSVGQVAFDGIIDGPGVNSSNSSGIWTGNTGSLSLVAREGESAPGTGAGVVFYDIGAFDIDGSGQVVFGSTLLGPEVDDDENTGFGIWSDTSGALALIARGGDPASYISPGAVLSSWREDLLYGFSHFGDPMLDEAGQTVFTSRLRGSGVNYDNDRVILLWSTDEGKLIPVARTGEPAHGMEPGVVYHILSFARVSSDSEQIIYLANLTGPSPGVTNSYGLFGGDIDSLRLIAMQGDSAPGTGTGTVFGREFLYPSALNRAGQTTFVNYLAGAGVNNTNHSGIWAGSPESLRLVALAGNAAPGTTQGVVFGEINVDLYLEVFRDPQLNDTGHVAFLGRLTGPGVDFTTDQGIWSDASGSLELIAREGSQAPGIEPGVLFGGMGNLLFTGTGQVAFICSLTGPGVNGTNNTGIWATDPDGVLTLIVRTGDTFDVNDDPLIDDFRIIRYASYGAGPSFNDLGHLAFNLEFTDGSEGIFVATIPEPGTVGMLVVGAGVMLRRRYC